MIALVVSRHVYHFLEDYLKHITRYLQINFSLVVEIFIHERGGNVAIPENYSKIIFVQRVNWKIYRELHNTERDLFLMNTEQMTVPLYFNKVKDDIIKANIPVIDYSIENILLLKSLVPDIDFIHLPFPIIFEDFKKKSNDLISLKNSTYRKRVINSIELNITDFKGKWTVERDEIIRDSKILINIHHSPQYRIFEGIRCYHALEMGTLVISEPSIKMDHILLKDFIIFVNSDSTMKETVAEVLENYSVYYTQCFSPERLEIANTRFLEIYTTGIDKILN